MHTCNSTAEQFRADEKVLQDHLGSENTVEPVGGYGKGAPHEASQALMLGTCRAFDIRSSEKAWPQR